MKQQDKEDPRVEESPSALNFEYNVNRFGVLFLLAIIFSAVAGLFSNGLLSSASKQNSTHTLDINYDRFERLTSESEINITLQSLHASRYIVSIGNSLLNNYQLGDIRPEPDSMYSKGNTLYLIYNAADVQSPLSLWISVTPKKPGNIANTVKVNSEPEITFSQFVYP
ncbi:hypothetical protein GTGU_00538 [Trabulsiella guamensis ATCC 49490]|uniref:Uncharacterized protein n=1 Tax=Trabulsiella guamensis ATCC 49490 TaxID=1005994 RepID=A0A085AKU6_9ENTR|nr:hypothetical protein [Trabulsiella guamensis]KFC10841.1 hypothetical protein GTGU_00538 [Trabulsiella guamensis ATCC 49490]